MLLLSILSSQVQAIEYSINLSNNKSAEDKIVPDSWPLNASKQQWIDRNLGNEHHFHGSYNFRSHGENDVKVKSIARALISMDPNEADKGKQ